MLTGSKIFKQQKPALFTGAEQVGLSSLNAALKLVANDHVLSHTLQAEDGVRDHRQAPELAVVLAQVVGRKYGNRRFGCGHSIDAADSRVRAIQVGGLNFLVADAGLSRQPILSSK
jgi:hypothetical protein